MHVLVLVTLVVALSTAAVAPAPPASLPPAGPVAPEQGPRSTVTREAWGVAFSRPGGWKSAEEDGILMAGSETEAGLIPVRVRGVGVLSKLGSGNGGC